MSMPSRVTQGYASRHRKVPGVGGGGLAGKEVAGEEQYVGWPLGQPAHEPGKPERAVGNQHVATIAFTHQAQLFGALNAVKHLKLKLAFLDALGGGPFREPGDQRAVMRGNGRPDARLAGFPTQQALRKMKVI